MTEPENAVHPLSRAEWRRWLPASHTRPEGVWMISFKRHTGRPRVEYAAAVEEALCFGWIDSIVKTLDADRSMQWFAPRKPRSGWSASNKERVERLVREGLMTPAGTAKIDAAKADGSWTVLDSAAALEVPRDLQQALAAREPAEENFTAFPPSTKRMILEWIATARKPETRSRRIEETARLAAENKRAR